MYCMHCGNELPDDAKFCVKCGKLVAKTETELDVVAESEKDYDFFVDAETQNEPERVEIKDETRRELGNQILKFSILGLAFGITGILSILGIVFSYVAKSRLNAYLEMYGETEGPASVGKAINIGGTIASWVFFGFFTLYFILIVAGAIGSAGSMALASLLCA